MSNIRLLLNRLSTNLGALKEKVKLENYVNDMGLNVTLETRMLQVYNATFGTELENSNLFSKNTPGIDGIDKKFRLMVQVTSTFSPEKIEHTVKQVVDRHLYLNYDRLVFIFLGDKKQLSSSFKNRILSKIGDFFSFDFENDLCDLHTIYNEHFYRQHIDRVHKVVGILDEVLNYLPEHKESGFDAISVCFHDEEIANVFEVVNTIIKSAVNVYTSSQQLYNRFKDNPNRDYVIFANQGINLKNITFCITVLSHGFIEKNLGANARNPCLLFQWAMEEDIRIETICFDRFISNLKLVKDTRLKSYSSVNKSNLSKMISGMLNNRYKEAVWSTISPDEIIDEIIDTHKNFTSEIIHKNTDYTLIHFVMEQQDDLQLNYIIINREYNLGRLSEHYSTNFKRKYNRNVNVLVPKAFHQRTRRRLETVSTELGTAKVYYIDEHLFDKRYKSLEQNPILSTQDFVTPVVRHDGELLGVNDIIHWVFNNSDSSVAIISGSGGIGKTTISEKIHDEIIENHDRNIVLFINAKEYISVFRKKIIASDAEYDLYNIFKACHPHSSFIDRGSFYVNYSLGNIIVIFDGVDEIISTIPSFNLGHFIEHIENLRLQIGRGKIIINCRDFYVKDLLRIYEQKDLAGKESIRIYELLGFDVELSQTYFAKRFGQAKQQQACIKLLPELYPANDEARYKYPPFILEIVSEIVATGFDYKEIKTDFNSALLLPDDFMDVVMFRICNREITKKEDFGFDLTIDEQIRFFCFLAMEEKGRIEELGVKRVMEAIGLADRVDERVKGMLDHPLLSKTNGDINFRFDFLNIHFKSIGIYNLMCENSVFPITDRIISILRDQCNFNSVLFKSLVSKIIKSKEKFPSILQFTKQTFELIVKHGGNTDSTKQAISNLSLILFKVTSIINYSGSLIKDLFGEELDDGRYLISKFYFIGVPSSAEIVLDLQGHIFTHSEINGYSNFFKCLFDAETFFDDNCIISSVFSNKVNLATIKAQLSNFDKNIKGDNSIFKMLKFKESKEDYVKYFRNYLKNFYHNRIFTPRKFIKDIEIIYDENINVHLLTNLLLKNDIVLDVNKDEVILNDKFKSRIIKFITQTFTFPELKKCIRELEAYLLDTIDTGE